MPPGAPGWSMPVQYTSILEEHQAVRTAVGLFDISHMARLFFSGPDAAAWLDRVTTNHVARLKPGQIQYSLIVNERGGILDDILVYHLDRDDSLGADREPTAYLVVGNASNRAKVVDWFERHRGGFDARLNDATTRTAMIAVQGPKALETLQAIARWPGAGPSSSRPLAEMEYYTGSCSVSILGPDGLRAGSALTSRTGYTGEDGFELIVPAEAAVEVWEKLLEAGRPAGIRPCGLGARDTLRFEAAMPLYGHEMDETVDPYEAGLGWAVKLAKGGFVGRDALRQRKTNVTRQRVGLALAGKRIARQGYPVLQEESPVGVVTSGTFAPTLGRSLAMALVEAGAAAVGTTLAVEVRGALEPAEVVPLPFYKRGARPAAPPAENAPS